MCKLVLIPNASNIIDFDEFAKLMSWSLSDQSDGFGFAAVGKDGVFGAKSVLVDPLNQDIPQKPWIDVSHSPIQNFGKKSEVIGAAMFHGRISTNKKDILNTHPLKRDNHYIVHNGVVTHHGKKYKKLTQNDTEDVLFNFLTGGIDEVAKNLTGYYACGIIDKDLNFHVFRDGVANLHYAHSDLIGDIFATTKELIEEIGQYLNETLSAYPVLKDQYIKYDQNGEVLEHKTFKSRGYDSYSKGLSWKSLGYDLDDRGYMTDSDYRSTDWTKWPDEWKDDTNSRDIVDPNMDMTKYVSDYYLDEIQLVNEDYLIECDNEPISHKEFMSLPLTSKIQCVVIRPDGTELDPFKERKVSGE